MKLRAWAVRTLLSVLAATVTNIAGTGSASADGSPYLPIERIGEWQRRNHHALARLFDPALANRLRLRRPNVSPQNLGVLYGTWENPWAPGGGLLAVAKQIHPSLDEASHRAWRVTPNHARLVTGIDPPKQDEGLRFQTHFAGRSVTTRLILREHEDFGPWHMIHADDAYLKADGGADHKSPYEYSCETATDAAGGNSLLLRDALFFSAAVPAMLEAVRTMRPGDLQLEVGTNRQLADSIGVMQEAPGLVFHANDWQTISTALTLKEALLHGGELFGYGAIGKPIVSVATLHNVIDHVLPWWALATITGRYHDERWPRLTEHGDPTYGVRDTVLTRMLPLLDAPFTTVSPGYGQELRTDPLAVYMAPQLSDVISVQGGTGVDNGPFVPVKPPFTERAVRAARGSDFAPILAEKHARRENMLQFLARADDERMVGRIDDAGALPDDVPVFFFFGRFDPSQKGFDVLKRAILKAEENGVDARYVFAPDLPNRNGPFWEDLRELATHDKLRGKVVMFPYRMSEGYADLMGGATYAVMASMYEPFGAANEAAIAGTPVIARATGGIPKQVPFHVGLTYREDPLHLPGWAPRDVYLQEITEWRQIMQAPTPADREKSQLYRHLVAAATKALGEGNRIFRHDPAQYGTWLANGFDYIKSTFSWERAAREYQAVYRTACEAE